MNPAVTPSARGQRTYYVSDERLRAFAQLSYAQRLQWVEQCSQFVRLAQQAMAKARFVRDDYFVADGVGHVAGKPVFNLAVGLRDGWGK